MRMELPLELEQQLQMVRLLLRTGPVASALTTLKIAYSEDAQPSELLLVICCCYNILEVRKRMQKSLSHLLVESDHGTSFEQLSHLARWTSVAHPAVPRTNLPHWAVQRRESNL